MKSGVPKSPNRRRVLQQVQANPGSCMQELADQTRMTRTALAHHLRALMKSDLVQGVRQGRRVLLFPTTIKRATERSVLGMMRQASARNVLQALYQQPTESYRKLAAKLGITPHSLRWHVGRLQQQGLIHVVQHGIGGKSHTVHFHPAVRESLKDLQAPAGTPPAETLLAAREMPLADEPVEPLGGEAEPALPPALLPRIEAATGTPP